MSLKIEEVVECLNAAQVDKDVFNRIVAEAEKIEESKKMERGAKTRDKSQKQWVVVVKSAAPLPEEDIVAHVFQMDGEDDAGDIVKKVERAATEHNLSCRKKNNLVQTFDDCPHVKRKHSKEAGYILKTKEDWCRVVVLSRDVKFGGIKNA